MKKYDVSALAELSMLDFDERELIDVEASLNEIMKLAEMLDEMDVDVSQLNTSDVTGDNVFRNDNVELKTESDKVLDCCIFRNDRYIVVPTVVEGE